MAKKPVVEKEPEEVIVDLKAAVALKPEQRLKWLTKACNMVTDGLASSTDLFDIIVSRKFVAGMPQRVVRKISALIEDNTDSFSDKQKKYLASVECPIVARLTVREPAEPVEYGNEDDRMPSGPAADADSALDVIRQRRELLPMPRTSALVGEKRQPMPPDEGGSSSDAKWMSVKDEGAIRRHEAERKEKEKREELRRAEKRRSEKAEEEAATKSAELEKAERRKKLEEEADALLFQAVSAPAPMALVPLDKEKPKTRSMSRSRSISAGFARRIARENKAAKQAQKHSHWRKDAGRSTELSGSRAIFMNRDFVEDLPHMARPSIPGTQGVGGSLHRDSRDSPQRRDDSRPRTRRRR